MRLRCLDVRGDPDVITADLASYQEARGTAENVPFAAVNLMSANPGMRWDIEETRTVVGYLPHGHLAVEPD